MTTEEPCFFCDTEMPGLCFPKNRRNTGESERCYACLMEEMLFYRIQPSQLTPMDPSMTIGDSALILLHGSHIYTHPPRTRPSKGIRILLLLILSSLHISVHLIKTRSSVAFTDSSSPLYVVSIYIVDKVNCRLPPQVSNSAHNVPARAPPSAFGLFLSVINPISIFETILDYIPSREDQSNLLVTSTAIYNAMKMDKIVWRDSEFVFLEYYTNPAGLRMHGRPVLSQDGHEKFKEHGRWKIKIVGPELGYISEKTEGEIAQTQRTKETAKILFLLCQIAEIQVDSVPVGNNKIKEIIFSHMDMLPPANILGSRLRPFNLQRVHFNYCREFTMQRTAHYLAHLELEHGLPRITFNYRQQNLNILKQSNERTGIVANMFTWRERKPHLLLANLVDNVKFREFIHKMTFISADKWFDFCRREANETADLELLQQFSDERLVRGSKAATLQEPCISCGCVMPGLCFPKARRNTGVSESCHAYLIDDDTFWRVSASKLVPSLRTDDVDDEWSYGDLTRDEYYIYMMRAI